MKMAQLHNFTLAPQASPAMDFVWLYVAGPARGDELRYSIRSVFANYSGPVRATIIGDRPEWYAGLHIPIEQAKGSRIDRARKFWAIATGNHHIGDQFVAMQDDIYIVGQADFPDLQRRYFHGRPWTPESILQYRPSTNYQQQVLRTVSALFRRGRRYCLDYSTHTPKVYRKCDVATVVDDYRMLDQALVCTILFDNAIDRRDPPQPVQPYQFRMAKAPETATEVVQSAREKLFLNHVDEGWNDHVHEALQTMFPDPSPVEK